MSQPSEDNALVLRLSADVVLFRRDGLASSSASSRLRARLMHLALEWQAMARDIKGFRVLTPMTAERSFGFCAFALDDVPSKVVAERLRKEFHIVVQNKAARPYLPYDNAVRVTPQPFASRAEIQQFVAALRVIART